MRRLTVHRRREWPTKEASMVAVSRQKLTYDRTYTALDVWKVGAALELLDTSWTVEVGERRIARSGVVWACGTSRRVFLPIFSRKQITLLTTHVTHWRLGKKGVPKLIDIEELKVDA